MLKNYEKLPNGVVKQLEVIPFAYGFAYSNRYNAMGDLGTRMSYLRLGNLIGAIGHVPQTLLDVGYGNGDFLAASKDIIPGCFGSDITREYPIPVGCTFVEDIYNDHYEVVCFFDVLEHFPDIYDISKLNCNYVYISLPWCHYFSDDWFDQWKHRKPNEHLWHFNDRSLVAFFDEIGYDNIGISNIEDTIRRHPYEYSNILTGIFRKRKV